MISYSSVLSLNLSGMFRDPTEEVEGRKVRRMGRGENACAWINMNNDSMLNFCKMLMICCYSVKPVCGRDCWGGNVIATSKLVIVSALHQCYQFSVCQACGRIKFPGALVIVWTLRLLVDTEFKAEMTMTNVMVKSEHFISEVRPSGISFSSGIITSRGPDSCYSISLGPGVIEFSAE